MSGKRDAAVAAVVLGAAAAAAYYVYKTSQPVRAGVDSLTARAGEVIDEVVVKGKAAVARVDAARRSVGSGRGQEEGKVRECWGTGWCARTLWWRIASVTRRPE